MMCGIHEPKVDLDVEILDVDVLGLDVDVVVFEVNVDVSEVVVLIFNVELLVREADIDLVELDELVLLEIAKFIRLISAYPSDEVKFKAAELG